MPVKQPPAAPKVEDMDGEFRVRRFTMRGVHYVIRELSAADHQKCIEAATVLKDGREQVDNQVLFAVMVDKCLEEPKIKASEVMGKPYPVVRRINDIIDDMHYAVEEVVEEDSSEEDEGQGEAKG